MESVASQCGTCHLAQAGQSIRTASGMSLIAFVLAHARWHCLQSGLDAERKSNLVTDCAVDLGWLGRPLHSEKTESSSCP
jgi:hypothetical protein